MKRKGRGLEGGLFAAIILAAPHPGWSQTAPLPPLAVQPSRSIDVLPDVVITVRPGLNDPADVIGTRMSRVARCVEPDAFSPDPTAKFNQAYYEELTGNADHYATIRGPKPKVVYRYPSALHPGELMFRNLSGSFSMGGPAGMNGPTNPTGNASCSNRARMEKSVEFARALAMYDKGEYARALPAFIEAHGKLRASPMAGEAALMIAGMYMRGQGTPKDAALAIDWLKKAVGSQFGSKTMNLRYDPGQPDRYYSIASEAAMALGLIYLTGNGVPKDEALARQWVETAMRYRHVPAIKVAADMYYSGFGGRQNLRDALMHYELAGGARHAPAAYSAGAMYDVGEGTRANRKKALQRYTEAATIGSAAATLALAVAYDTGDGVPANPARAVVLYKIAAVAGDPEAQTAMGTYFYEGGPVEKDLPAARAWFTQAARQGDLGGMVNLAAMLINGEGGEADLVKAWAWLSIARDGGRDDAAAALARLERRMSPEEVVMARALIDPQEATSGG